MAINVRELRIGSIIYYEGDTELNDAWFGEDVIVAEIKEEEIFAYSLSCYLDGCKRCYHIKKPSCFEPIPLTEIWLKKFGFVTADYEVDQIIWDYNDHFCLVQDGVPPEQQPIVFEWEDGANNHETHIRYVHQLQNLYYALTGEELKIEES